MWNPAEALEAIILSPPEPDEKAIPCQCYGRDISISEDEAEDWKRKAAELARAITLRKEQNHAFIIQQNLEARLRQVTFPFKERRIDRCVGRGESLKRQVDAWEKLHFDELTFELCNNPSGNQISSATKLPSSSAMAVNRVGKQSKMETISGGRPEGFKQSAFNGRCPSSLSTTARANGKTDKLKMVNEGNRSGDPKSCPRGVCSAESTEPPPNKVYGGQRPKEQYMYDWKADDRKDAPSKNRSTPRKPDYQKEESGLKSTLVDDATLNLKISPKKPRKKQDGQKEESGLKSSLFDEAILSLKISSKEPRKKQDGQKEESGLKSTLVDEAILSLKISEGKKQKLPSIGENTQAWTGVDATSAPVPKARLENNSTFGSAGRAVDLSHLPTFDELPVLTTSVPRLMQPPIMKTTYAQAAQPRNHLIVLDRLPLWFSDIVVLQTLYEMWLPADWVEFSLRPSSPHFATAMVKLRNPHADIAVFRLNGLIVGCQPIVCCKL